MTCTHVYVGRLICGCAVAVVVDEPDRPKDTAKTVHEYMLEGYTIDRMTVEDYRKNVRLSGKHTCGLETVPV
jgi:hypothetical protein